MVDIIELVKRLEEDNKSFANLAETLGYNRSTIYRKFQNNNFTITDVKGIKAFLSLSWEETISIFFDTDVTKM